MNPFSRGVRNTFRNPTRTVSIVIILSLSIGLSLAMVIARKAVEEKIQSVKSSVGTTITVSAAGVRGFEGGGNPLTQTQLSKVKTLAHVTSIDELLNDRLTTSNTNLQSSVDLGQLGQRFAQNGGSPGAGGGGFGGFGSGAGGGGGTFTPPITLIGTTNPTNLASTQGGGTFTLKSGNTIDGSSSSDVALLGTSLASKNNLKAGSTFTAYGTTITVSGIFDSGNQFSNNVMIMPLATVQTLSSQSGDITSAIVNIDSLDNLSSATSAVQSTLGSSADVTNSQDTANSIVTPLENVKSISAYSLIGAIAAGSIIILMTMVMIVRERRREIGVLKAIGASNIKVALQFVSEAVTFTLLAAVIGIIIGVAAGNPITNTLVSNSTSSSTTSAGAPGGPGAGPRAGGFGRFGGAAIRQNITKLHTNIGWSIIAYGIGVAVLIAVIGSSVAAWFIAKVRPAEVMRTE